MVLSREPESCFQFGRHYQSPHESGPHPSVLGDPDGDFCRGRWGIYNPRSWLDNALLQLQNRECFRRLLEQGWTDAFRHKYGDERMYTYWDYFRRQRGKGFGLRIDHLLLSSAVVSHLRDAGVRDLSNASAHAPAWIEVSQAKRTARRAQ
jgi:exodeoxyribonuclease-3